ncbi:ABC transporter ATP-binding protein [Paenibacillus sp. BC26]|uniref:ABC transporter ATP-binding protein n=1 Tax=Paenibacillus sp. BC26 TaxID=1881032 RepID=UPI0008F057E6|nr:ABC transporter ATP-binding protein [Paenibacillus sp. BC26]SFT05189.1 ATP-binding cassette, subfamily B [Paenibacillus sp. BC26]
MKKPKLLSDYMKSKWVLYVIAVCAIGTANVILARLPRTIGSFTDELHKGTLAQADIAPYSLLVAAIALGYGILGGSGQFLIMYLGRLFERLTRGKLFIQFTRLSLNNYSKYGVGKLLNYLINDVTAVRESISMGINHITNSSILLISVIVSMMLSSIPAYAILISLIPLLFIPWFVAWLGPIIRKRSVQVQESLGKMTETAAEQFSGIRVTKKFAAEAIMTDRFDATVAQIRDNQLQLVRVSSLLQAVIPFLGALSMIASIATAGYLTANRTISLGDFVTLVLYIGMLINPLQRVGDVINAMQRARASLERLNDLLGVEPDVPDTGTFKLQDPAHAAIDIRKLSFVYPDGSSPVLSEIDLTLPPGISVGIIGKTGSGKTTLIKLLLRIYDPPAGTIFADGLDIRSVTLESLRSSIGYVPQDGFLFSTSIRENIGFSNRGAALEEIERAALQAHIHQEVHELPDGFETRLGERGLSLSGGQRQRASLARGLFKQAPIMILDDSVSAIDTLTEKAIIDSLRAERQGKTTIIVSHRISALKHADLIIVMDEGRIVQRGTHEQLVAAEGVYARLYAIQEEGDADVESHR